MEKNPETHQLFAGKINEFRRLAAGGNLWKFNHQLIKKKKKSTNFVNQSPLAPPQKKKNQLVEIIGREIRKSAAGKYCKNRHSVVGKNREIHKSIVGEKYLKILKSVVLKYCEIRQLAAEKYCKNRHSIVGKNSKICQSIVGKNIKKFFCQLF